MILLLFFIKAGEILSAYEVEKRRATEKEDYDFARMKKMQMDDYRRKIYKDLELQDLCRHCVIDFWVRNQEGVGASLTLKKRMIPLGKIHLELRILLCVE